MWGRKDSLGIDNKKKGTVQSMGLAGVGYDLCAYELKHISEASGGLEYYRLNSTPSLPTRVDL